MKIGVAGCTGRVGQILVEELQAEEGWIHEELELACGSIQNDKGKKFSFPVTKSAEELFEKSDVVVDFTLPEGTRNHARIAAEMKKPLIVGTTGLDKADEEALLQASKETAIVYSANMSIGVNILQALVQQTAERLGLDWDIEIFEAHHKYKVDSPSGTAIMLGKAAATGRGKSLDNLAVYERYGRIGTRPSGTIGFATARGGDVVGEHKVTFYGEGERVELGHMATDRSLFAKGALRAALWTKDKQPGLYSMRDVLNL